MFKYKTFFLLNDFSELSKIPRFYIIYYTIHITKTKEFRWSFNGSLEHPSVVSSTQLGYNKSNTSSVERLPAPLVPSLSLSRSRSQRFSNGIPWSTLLVFSNSWSWYVVIWIENDIKSWYLGFINEIFQGGECFIGLVEHLECIRNGLWRFSI